MSSSGFRGSFVTGFVLLCCLHRETLRTSSYGYRLAGPEHALEPRDDVDQIKNNPRSVAVPCAYGMLKGLERKSAAVKRLASLWGSSIRFPVESLVRAPSSTRFRRNVLHVARRRGGMMTSVDASVFRMGYVEFVRVLAHGG